MDRDPVTVHGSRCVCPETGDVDMAIQVPGNVPWFLRYAKSTPQWIWGTTMYTGRESMIVGNYGREGKASLQDNFPKKTVALLKIPRSEIVHIVELSIEEVRENHWIYELLDIQQAPLVAWKTALVLEGLRRKIAARTIQRQFRESMSNPNYRMCKKRLLREFTSM